MGETVRYGTAGQIATLTLNRPERYNAIDDDLPGELRAAVERADEDSSIHAIVLTGAGEAG